VADNAGSNEGARRGALPAGMLTRAEAVGIVIEARREHARQQYDWFKHQTTLSTGSILVVSGLVGSVLDYKRFEWLVVATLVCLVLSTVLAFFAMFCTFLAGGAEELMLADEGVSINAAERQDAGTLERTATGWHLVALALGGLGAVIFLVSIVSFMLFALLNLAGGSWPNIVSFILFALYNLIGGLLL
jgi:hypothetical protein